jgi:hypothetical protein
MKKLVLLQKKEKSKIFQVPCEIDFLSLKDENEACSFYNAMAKQIRNPEIFVPDNTLSSDLVGDGIVLGVRAENNLICIRVLTHNFHTISEYKSVLGEKVTGNLICSDGCVVDKRYRGNSLQQLTWFMIEPILHGKYDCVVATVSPKNHVSLKNLLICGFVIVALADMYSGYERFLLRKKLIDTQCIKTSEHMEINILDKNRITDVLSRGFVGFRMKYKPLGVHILFGQEMDEK